MQTELHPKRMSACKKSFATRRVPQHALHALERSPVGFRAGDVVLATVTGIGQHPRIEMPNGRLSALSVGDEIILACGNRYAPDQFHAHLPEEAGPAQMVAAGGIAGVALSRHFKMKPATQIEIQGRFRDAKGRPVNVADYALPLDHDVISAPIIAVVGTSMNAGKTTTCAAIVKGIAQVGLRPGYVKITGTGAGGDLWAARDAGAMVALDFTDAGFATTYKASPEILIRRGLQLVSHAVDSGSGIVVVEVADGLLQAETNFILKDKRFRDAIDGTVLAASDALGALASVEWLNRHDHKVLAVSGAIFQAPLAVRELREMTDARIASLSQLENGEFLADMAARAGGKTRCERVVA
ncbi:MAG: DUF1611 domain-containing protein [Pseudomonadota bacterium]